MPPSKEQLRRKERKRRAFLRFFKKTRLIKLAAAKTGVTRCAVWMWVKSDAKYREQFERLSKAPDVSSRRFALLIRQRATRKRSRQEKFLRNYKKFGRVDIACKETGIAVGTHWCWTER